MAFHSLAILTLSLLLAVSLRAADDTWFPFMPENTDEPGVIGMADWLDAPAGKHGAVLMRGSGFVFEDGTPVRFWGLNNGSGGCAPAEEEADRRAAWYAKYGVNAVRLHKFTNPCKSDTVSTELETDAWKRIDYYCARLREKGIYYGWSHIYHHRIRPGDAERLIAYDELKKHCNSDTYGLVNFARDLQDLHIELTVNMLKHRNGDTGLTYAEDPALSFIELQNEDDIFFGATWSGIRRSPSYRKEACRQF
jgi:hypothetical protein